MTGAEVTEVLALAEAATASDGVAPLSEHVLLHLRYDGQRADPGPGRDLLVSRDGAIAGYAYLDALAPRRPAGRDAPDARVQELSGELVVHPDHRRHGLGLALVRDMAAAADAYPIRVWAHGDLPAAAALARAAGFERFRALWQLRRSLAAPLDQPAFPAGRTLRTFRPGQDDDEWLVLNGRAFAEHPEQGAWRRHDLELREREPWFDQAGFFIAEHDGTMAGFCWTKVHGPGNAPGSVGEIYVVGVDPGERGTGLGRALTLAGLHYLRDHGLTQAMLYVDEDNAPAIRMYEALGFTRSGTDAMYRHPGGGGPPPPPPPPPPRRPPPPAGGAGGAPPGGGDVPPPAGGHPPRTPRILAAVDAERLVEFRGRQRPVGGRHRGQHLGVELNLVKGDAVVNTKIQLLGNRAHLRR
jgi:mycothiol synthase